MDIVWILAAVFAAACQTARSAFQKNMILTLDELTDIEKDEEEEDENDNSSSELMVETYQYSDDEE